MQIKTAKLLFSRLLPNEKILEIKFLPAGLSNNNYQVTTLNNTYLLKCYTRPLPLNQLEIQNELANKGICAPTLAYNKSDSTCINLFIEADIAENYFPLALVPVLVKLHKSLSFNDLFSISEHFKEYKNHQHYNLFKQEINSNLIQLAKLPILAGFCHNDLVQNNILKTIDSIMLIDFEYAKMNDVFFDLAAVASSYNLNSKQKKHLLALYFQLSENSTIPEYAPKKLKIYCLLYDLLCYFWYSERQLIILAENSLKKVKINIKNKRLLTKIKTELN